MKHNILILHKFFRLTKFFPATAGTYGLSMAFSPSGRIQSRKRDITVSFNSFADDIFGYCEDLHPHAPVRIFETRGHSLTDLVWDGAGNLAQASTFYEMQYGNSRFLFWTVDSRLHTTADQKHFSYYAYDHAGERTFKLTGSNNVMDVNANDMFTAAWLKTPTIYPTPYLVLSSHGYTKHYYVGSERLCARIGGGGLFAPFTETPLTNRADSLFQASLSECQNRVLDGNQEGCIHSLVSGYDEVIQSYLEAPQRLVAQAAIDLTQFDHDINHCFTGCGPEPEVYYYHGDHLGSASWITDAHGNPVQHLQYLPFGEPFVDQHAPLSTYSERFTFTGKERDAETGYSYFGARYYDSDLSGLFLSIDPMADKYPSISPYAYCAWNPLKLVDPDGREIDNWIINIQTGETTVEKAKDNNITVVGCGVKESYSFPDGDFCLNVNYTENDDGSSCQIIASGGSEYNNASLYLDYSINGQGQAMKRPRTFDDIVVPDYLSYTAPKGYGAGIEGVFCGIIGVSVGIGVARDGLGKWSGYFNVNYAVGVEAGIGVNFFSINSGQGVKDIGGENQVISASAFIATFSRNFATKTNSIGYGYGLKVGLSAQLGYTWTF